MENEVDCSQDTLPPRSSSRSQSVELRSKLSLIVLWHNDRDMIGRSVQYPKSIGSMMSVSRFSPIFHDPENTNASALIEPHVSRKPITIERLSSTKFQITPAKSQMTVYVNGNKIGSAVTATLNDHNGIIFITLSNHVILGICQVPITQLAGPHNSLLGISPAINQCRKLINRFAATNLPVMLMGETGTGKELAAGDIHKNSERSNGPLVTINMAAIPQELAVTELFGSKKGAFTGSTHDRVGFFQKAEGGTLFCDEVGDTPPSVQPMLLRALEASNIQVLGVDHTTPINVRFIAATDRSVDLDKDGYRFSKPLYHRLSAAHITMPPLRERKVDIPLLVLHFIDQSSLSNPLQHTEMRASQISDLLLYSWPGNVRELKNAVNAIMLGEEPNLIDCSIPLSSMRSSVKEQYRAPASVANDELIAALNKADWLIKPAAESLSISRTSCYELIKKCSVIRSVEDIPLKEMREVMARHPGDLAAWSIALKVPQEALKKHVRSTGLIQ